MHRHVQVCYDDRMATLEKRVQVLFDPAQYERIAAEARSLRVSVGALIRETMDERLARRRADAQAALQQLWERADANPGPSYSPEQWETEKDALVDRPALRDIR